MGEGFQNGDLSRTSEDQREDETARRPGAGIMFTTSAAGASMTMKTSADSP